MKKLLFLLLFTVNAFATDYTFVIKPGDTLSKYFKQTGLSNSLLINIINSSNTAKKLNNLKLGKKIVINKNGNAFNKITYFYSNKYAIVVTRNGKRLSSNVITHTNGIVTKGYKKYTLTIRKNLFTDGKKSGLSFAQINRITQIIDKHINPSQLRKNDTFTIFANDDNILAVKYYGRKNFTLFKWQNTFYDKYGKTTYPMFLEAPLKYKRISSGFTYNRFHPILKVNRPHRAIDYAANKGTPVRASSFGEVSEKGFHGALGNVVRIKHPYGYETVYAHLSKFARGLTKGMEVRKGQIIAYVGSTGRSTGNHLHYELKKDGEYVNPQIHKPILSFSLKGSEKREFQKYITQFN